MTIEKFFNKLIYILIIVLTISLAGVSAAADVDARTDAEGAAAKPDPYAKVNLEDLRQDCFYKRAANNWTALDRTRLIVYESGKRRPFLVEISPPSFRLRSATTIGFVSNNSRVCGYAGERVIIGDGPDSGFQIIRITRLDEARRDELLAVRKEIRAAGKEAGHEKSESAEGNNEASSETSGNRPATDADAETDG